VVAIEHNLLITTLTWTGNSVSERQWGFPLCWRRAWLGAAILQHPLLIRDVKEKGLANQRPLTDLEPSSHSINSLTAINSFM
jgi:hypothetical protein